jgi:hypothetical protein
MTSEVRTQISKSVSTTHRAPDRSRQRDGRDGARREASTRETLGI